MYKEIKFLNVLDIRIFLLLIVVLSYVKCITKSNWEVPLVWFLDWTISPCFQCIVSWQACGRLKSAITLYRRGFVCKTSVTMQSDFDVRLNAYPFDFLLYACCALGESPRSNSTQQLGRSNLNRWCYGLTHSFRDSRHLCWNTPMGTRTVPSVHADDKQGGGYEH